MNEGRKEGMIPAYCVNTLARTVSRNSPDESCHNSPAAFQVLEKLKI